MLRVYHKLSAKVCGDVHISHAVYYMDIKNVFINSEKIWM